MEKGISGSQGFIVPSKSGKVKRPANERILVLGFQRQRLVEGPQCVLVPAHSCEGLRHGDLGLSVFSIPANDLFRHAHGLGIFLQGKEEPGLLQLRGRVVGTELHGLLQTLKGFCPQPQGPSHGGPQRPRPRILPEHLREFDRDVVRLSLTPEFPQASDAGL